MQTTEEFLIETADRCKRLARAGRELAANLETMGNDFMAKAVEPRHDAAENASQAQTL